MIHSFTQQGITLVVDVYSGSVHVVDEQAAQLIHLREHMLREQAQRRFLEIHPDADQAEVVDCLDAIDALEEAGKLYAGEEVVSQAAQAQVKQPRTV